MDTISKADMLAATVRVNISETGHGSGVILSDGVVVTAAHVTTAVVQKESLNVVTSDGTKHAAETMWESKEYDISLLTAPSVSAKTKPHLRCSELEAGEVVYVTGYPRSEPLLLVKGTVASRHDAPYTDSGYHWGSLRVLDITVGGGNSGGPVFDAQGSLVGIVVAGQPTPLVLRGAHYIVPGPALCKLLGR